MNSNNSVTSSLPTLTVSGSVGSVNRSNPVAENVRSAQLGSSNLTLLADVALQYLNQTAECQIDSHAITDTSNNRTSPPVPSVTKKEIIHACSICGKAFTRHAQIKIHNLIHTREKPYVCNACGFACNHLSNLYKHSNIHVNVNVNGKCKNKPYSCNICVKGFTTKRSLDRHNETFHYTREELLERGNVESQLTSTKPKQQKRNDLFNKNHVIPSASESFSSTE